MEQRVIFSLTMKLDHIIELTPTSLAHLPYIHLASFLMRSTTRVSHFENSSTDLPLHHPNDQDGE